MSEDTPAASFEDAHPDQAAFLAEALDGLTSDPKTLPCKYFYDEAGSELFRQICQTPEYYVTRVETALLHEVAAEVAADIGPGAWIIEYGTGSSEKIRVLLGALDAPGAFVGVDMDGESLRGVTEGLARDFPDLAVHAVCADFTQPFALPEASGGGRRVVFFPGSSLGNFDHAQAVEFLRGAARLAGPGGGMLIGIDLKKDEAVLNAAYDDAAGVTAAFNLNLLERLNRECGADFDIAAFRHRAYYNAAEGRVEMHLVSQRRQSISLGGTEIEFTDGETIHTENSYKYAVDEFQALSRRAGFRPVHAWTDAENLFSLHFLAVPAG